MDHPESEAVVPADWRPAPFREFIFKVSSRCDLACDYCYVYEMADQSWRHQPRLMAPETIQRAAERVAEHVRSHGLPQVEVILHGGEPLLAGPRLIASAVGAVRAAVGPDAEVGASIQTNGVLLGPSFLKLFEELDVRVGISLDGEAAAHDRHRRHANGRGSHAAVSVALERLTSPPYRHLFSGLLCTVDLRNDSLHTYEALLEHAPPNIDFLLPHGNWDAPPPGRSADNGQTPYADWLIPIFDRWYAAPRQPTRVRLFGEIIQLLLGRPSATELVGLSPITAVVVETDGGIEQVDTLKSAYEGATATGMHVDRDSFDQVLRLPSIAARQMGAAALASECRACRIHRICGGGLYAHRYKRGTGFANPSVYCRDLLRLIDHISRVVRADLAAHRR
jgi:uncharacterized protein